MSIQILLITHQNIGKCLLDTASKILATSPSNVHFISVPYDCNIEEIKQDIEVYLEKNNASDGFLILTDVFGATPCNLSQLFKNLKQVRILSGVNLPMLLRAINYAHLTLDEVTEKAFHGGLDGIQICSIKKTPKE